MLMRGIIRHRVMEKSPQLPHTSPVMINYYTDFGHVRNRRIDVSSVTSTYSIDHIVARRY